MRQLPDKDKADKAAPEEGDTPEDSPPERAPEATAEDPGDTKADAEPDVEAKHEAKDEAKGEDDAKGQAPESPAEASPAPESRDQTGRDQTGRDLAGPDPASQAPESSDEADGPTELLGGATAGDGTEDDDGPGPDRAVTGRGGWRGRYPVAARALSWTVTGLSVALVFVALLLPTKLELLTVDHFTRIPVERSSGPVCCWCCRPSPGEWWRWWRGCSSAR